MAVSVLEFMTLRLLPASSFIERSSQLEP